MPVSGDIISDYGQGKDLHKLKNGLVFKVKRIICNITNEWNSCLC